MIDIDTALREMTETEEEVADMLLSDSFFNELSRIRLDLGVSPHLPISNEMCKWIVLAYLRSSQEYATNSKREPLTVAEIQDVLRNTFVDDTVQTDDMVLIRAIERAHDIGEKK